MQRILILTQDPATARAVESVARVDGRVVRAEGTAERCLIAVREWRPSLVIVDTGLGMTSGGLSAILRDEAVEDTAAVMVLLPPSQLNLLGPNVHVDDFAVTPVNEEELRTRMSRLIWAQSGAEDGSVIRHGTLLIDLELRQRAEGRFRSLDDAMVALFRAGARADRFWTAREVVAELDELGGTDVFARTTDAWLDEAEFPVLTGAYEALGLRSVDGELRVDPERGRALRDAIISAP